MIKWREIAVGRRLVVGRQRRRLSDGCRNDVGSMLVVEGRCLLASRAGLMARVPTSVIGSILVHLEGRHLKSKGEGE